LPRFIVLSFFIRFMGISTAVLFSCFLTSKPFAVDLEYGFGWMFGGLFCFECVISGFVGLLVVSYFICRLLVVLHSRSFSFLLFFLRVPR